MAFELTVFALKWRPCCNSLWFALSKTGASGCKLCGTGHTVRRSVVLWTYLLLARSRLLQGSLKRTAHWSGELPFRTIYLRILGNDFHVWFFWTRIDPLEQVWTSVRLQSTTIVVMIMQMFHCSTCFWLFLWSIACDFWMSCGSQNIAISRCSSIFQRTAGWCPGNLMLRNFITSFFFVLSLDIRFFIQLFDQPTVGSPLSFCQVNEYFSQCITEAQAEDKNCDGTSMLLFGQ